MHEAAHFVVDQWYRLGAPISLTIVPTKSYDGKYDRKAPVFFHFITCENKGRRPSLNDPEMRGVSAGNFRASLQAYQFLHMAYLCREIIMDLAGASAEEELCGGVKNFSQDDAFAAVWKSRLYCKDEAAVKMTTGMRHMSKLLCGGILAPAILGIAEELDKNKTLQADELNTLWRQLNPGRTPPWPHPNSKGIQLGPV